MPSSGMLLCMPLKITDVSEELSPSIIRIIKFGELGITLAGFCRRNLVPTSADIGVLRGQRGGSPTVVNLSFLNRSRYFSFK
jgi:hypothetical protein